MPARLLDTNIVSYWIRRDPLYRRYRHHLIGHVLFISFQTFSELQEWALNAYWNPAKQQRFLSHVGSLTVL